MKCSGASSTQSGSRLHSSFSNGAGSEVHNRYMYSYPITARFEKYSRYNLRHEVQSLDTHNLEIRHISLRLALDTSDRPEEHSTYFIFQPIADKDKYKHALVGELHGLFNVNNNLVPNFVHYLKEHVMA